MEQTRPRRRADKEKAPKQARPTREIRPGDPEEIVSLAASALTVIALVCLWMVVQVVLLGGASHDRSQELLYAKFRAELSQATAPTGALDFEEKPVEPGSPVALLTIPALGLSQVVVDGTASGDLMAGPGHLRNTPLPGQAGTSVVFGRAATYGAPFRDLARLKVGEVIEVQNAEGKVSYKVTGLRRAGDPVPAAPTTATGGRLTLVTAEGSGPLKALKASSALYVDASTEAATPPGVVASAVPDSEKAMGRDTAALPVLVILLGLLAFVAFAITVARRRFAAVLVWVVATPVVIALAWSVTDQVMRLLPNLM